MNSIILIVIIFSIVLLTIIIFLTISIFKHNNKIHKNYKASDAILNTYQRQNCYRNAAGLNDLIVDPELAERAQDWSDYLKK